MLNTIAIVLLILWMLGLVSSYTIGGFIHILLVVALVMFLVNVLQGRKIFDPDPAMIFLSEPRGPFLSVRVLTSKPDPVR